MKTTVNVQGMTCQHCVGSVSGALGDLPNVQDVVVDLEHGQDEDARGLKRRVGADPGGGLDPGQARHLDVHEDEVETRLSAHLDGLGAVGGQMLAAGLIVSLVPVVICFLFGAYVLRMNRAMLFGAMMGARTCAPAMEIISDTARSNIPALGYAGTYAIANVLLTLAGTLIVIIWPGLQ